MANAAMAIVTVIVFILAPNIKLEGLKADWRRPEWPAWKAIGEASERSVKN